MNVLPLDTILVPVDFSEPSLNALAVAIRLGQQQQTSLHLVYVLDPDSSGSAAANGSLPDLSNGHLLEEGLPKVQKLAAQIAGEQRISCVGSCRAGKIPDEVAALAHEINPGLIVVGTHSGSDRQAFRTNTDAYHIVKTALCPVMTVPDHRQWPAFERILFPVRPIPGALDKYEFARTLIRKNEAELTVLALSAPDEVISIQQLQDEITALNLKLAQDAVRSQTLFFETDSIAETILEKADELNADLLIITASLSTSSANLFIGPFAQQIIYNARLPVLSIRPESGLNAKVTRISWRYDQTDQGLTAIGF